MSGSHHRREPETTTELKRDIEQTRAELSDTVDALMTKVDIPARVRGRATETAHTVQERSRELTNDALDKLPPPAREKAEQAAAVVRRNPAPVALSIGGFLLALWLILRRTSD